MSKILVVGSSNTDLVIRVPEIPRPGETLLGGEFNTFPGGKGANQAVAAARAGGKVSFIAAVGDDAYGNEAKAGYIKDGIKTEYIKVCPGIASGIATITISHSGENAICVAPGANAELGPRDLMDLERVFEDSDWMLIQLETPLDTVQKAVELCEKLQVQVVLNPAPAAELPDSVLQKIRLITPNETEAETLTGVTVTDQDSALKAAEVLHAKGVATVVLTLGSRGAYLSDPATGIRELIPGFKVKAVDTTAAGDVFNGQLVVALSQGKTMKESIRLAHAAAALSVQKMGAQSSVPSKEEVKGFLESAG